MRANEYQYLRNFHVILNKHAPKNGVLLNWTKKRTMDDIARPFDAAPGGIAAKRRLHTLHGENRTLRGTLAVLKMRSLADKKERAEARAAMLLLREANENLVLAVLAAEDARIAAAEAIRRRAAALLALADGLRKHRDTEVALPHSADLARLADELFDVSRQLLLPLVVTNSEAPDCDR